MAAAGRGMLPFGITTIIGLALPVAIRLSRIKPARPIVLQPASAQIHLNRGDHAKAKAA